jgi:hypothetical protein
MDHHGHWPRAATVIKITREQPCEALKTHEGLIRGAIPMAMFWISTALGALGFAAIMLAIPSDDAQLLGKFPDSNLRYRDPTDNKQ